MAKLFRLSRVPNPHFYEHTSCGHPPDATSPVGIPYGCQEQSLLMQDSAMETLVRASTEFPEHASQKTLAGFARSDPDGPFQLQGKDVKGKVKSHLLWLLQ